MSDKTDREKARREEEARKRAADSERRLRQPSEWIRGAPRGPRETNDTSGD